MSYHHNGHVMPRSQHFTALLPYSDRQQSLSGLSTQSASYPQAPGQSHISPLSAAHLESKLLWPRSRAARSAGTWRWGWGARGRSLARGYFYTERLFACIEACQGDVFHSHSVVRRSRLVRLMAASNFCLINTGAGSGSGPLKPDQALPEHELAASRAPFQQTSGTLDMVGAEF